jgi:hypothetical protein
MASSDVGVLGGSNRRIEGPSAASTARSEPTEPPALFQVEPRQKSALTERNETKARVSFHLLLWHDDLRYSVEVKNESISRHFSFKGWISDLDGRFNGKPGTLWVEEDESGMREWQTDRGAYGGFLIMKGVEPEEPEGDAFRAGLHVSRQIMDVIENAITAANIQDQMISVKLDVFMDSSSKDKGSEIFFAAEHIDISELRRGDIVAFTVGRWRPGTFNRWGLSHPAINFQVSLSTGYRWRPRFLFGPDIFSFTGLITRSAIPQMEQRMCKIELLEYSPGLEYALLKEYSQSDRPVYPSAGIFRLEYSDPVVTLFYRATDRNRELGLFSRTLHADLWLTLPPRCFEWVG